MLSSAAHERVLGSCLPSQSQSPTLVSSATVVRKTMTVSTLAWCSTFVLEKIASVNTALTNQNFRTVCQRRGSDSSTAARASTQTAAALTKYCSEVSCSGNGKTPSAPLLKICAARRARTGGERCVWARARAGLRSGIGAVGESGR